MRVALIELEGGCQLRDQKEGTLLKGQEGVIMPTVKLQDTKGRVPPHCMSEAGPSMFQTPCHRMNKQKADTWQLRLCPLEAQY